MFNHKLRKELIGEKRKVSELACKLAVEEDLRQRYLFNPTLSQLRDAIRFAYTNDSCFTPCAYRFKCSHQTYSNILSIFEDTNRHKTFNYQDDFTFDGIVLEIDDKVVGWVLEKY